MKIAGVYGGKTNRGEIIQLSKEKKVEAALKDAVVLWSEVYKEGKYLCYLTDIKPNSVHASPSGEPFKKRWENNSYRSRGTCVIHFRDRNKDIIRPSKTASYEIVIKDTLDTMGLPDLKVESYSFKI